MDTAKTPDAAAAPAAPAPAHVSAQIVFADGIAVLDGKTAVSYDPKAKPPKDTTLVVVGRDVQQIGFANLAEDKGQVCVGPCHAVYVAINLGAQAGATKFTVKGVPPDAEDSQLRARIKLFLGAAPVEVTFV